MARVGVPAQGSRAEEGSVTAEFALGLPGVIATALLILAVLLAGATHLRCQEAARAGAREVMLTGDVEAGLESARRVAGEKAIIEVERSGRWVSVVVKQSLFLDRSPLNVAASMVVPLEEAPLVGRGGP